MNAILEVPQIPGQLRRLLDAGGLSDAAFRTGKRLLARLEADIRIVIAGPQGAGKALLFDALTAEVLPRTSLAVQEAADFHPESADICLWCTQTFAAAERAFWHKVPDRLKDHSLLVSIADATTAPQHLSPPQLHALEQVAAEEFYGLFPVVLPSTQIADLLREVAGIVHAGMMADADNAQMFLAAHGGSQASADVTVPQPGALSSAVSEGADPVMTQDTRTDVSAHQKTIDALRHCLDDLTVFLQDPGEAECEQILGICETAATAASETFWAADPQAGTASAMGDSLQAAADDILLLSLEGGVSPAIAAVTTLLQVKRALEVEIASPEAVFT